MQVWVAAGVYETMSKAMEVSVIISDSELEEGLMHCLSQASSLPLYFPSDSFQVCQETSSIAFFSSQCWLGR